MLTPFTTVNAAMRTTPLTPLTPALTSPDTSRDVPEKESFLWHILQNATWNADVHPGWHFTAHELKKRSGAEHARKRHKELACALIKSCYVVKSCTSSMHDPDGCG